jgi:hypothetical protein
MVTLARSAVQDYRFAAHFAAPRHHRQYRNHIRRRKLRRESCLVPGIVTVNHDHDRATKPFAFKHPTPKIRPVTIREQAEQVTQRGRRRSPLDFLVHCDVSDARKEADHHT